MDGPLAIYPEGDAAIIRFGTHNVRVEKERVLMDEKEGAKIGLGVHHVDLLLSEGTLVITADGVTVLTQKVDK